MRKIIKTKNYEIQIEEMEDDRVWIDVYNHDKDRPIKSVNLDPKEKDTYLIDAEAVFEAPQYTFMLQAESREKAEKEAKKIIKHDYPDWEDRSIFVRKVKDIEDVKSKLLLN